MGRRKLTAGRDPNLPFICYICGDTARGNNFSVLSCVSCKSFFRRHGLLKPENLTCKYNQRCIIDKETRGNCLPCRLTKCLSLGMDPQMIRCPANQSQRHQQSSPTKAKNKNKQIKSIDSSTISFPRPMDLLSHKDRSTLSSDQWSLLSNIIRSYDQQNLIDRIRRSLHEKQSLPVKLRTKSMDTLNLISEPMRSMLPLIERSPHYIHLSAKARQLLQTNNVFFTGAINGFLVARETDAFNNTVYMTACGALYGTDYMTKCAEDNRRLESNGNLVKLFLFSMIFSSNCSVVVYHSGLVNNDDLRSMKRSTCLELVGMQDIYVTMLWKYMVYLYGHDQAVKRFSLMIKTVIDMFKRVEELPENPAQNTNMIALFRKIECSASMA